MSKSSHKHKVAVFDIDGTIFRSSLQRELIMALVRYDVFPAIVKKELEQNYFSWVNRHGSYEDYIMQVVRSYERRIAGVSVEDVRRVAQIVIGQQKSRVYTYTRELIEKLRPTHRLVAISGSPIEIVQEFNAFYKFDVAYGMVFQTHDGRYTGEVLEVPIRDKRAVLARYLKEQGLKLAGSVGVGDGESDAPFLEAVARPICFNPNRNLYKIAKRKGWDIVVERKDVIYEL
ncbi:MAG: HAD family phosphatase [Candidatus Veblenbacteria bacterium]|nr:HAD family phosphatase [Candidatus Veblenbacteria bacterium]